MTAERKIFDKLVINNNNKKNNNVVIGISEKMLFCNLKYFKKVLGK